MRNNPFGPSHASLYDPASDVFTVAGSLDTPRHFHTATLLTSGKVLWSWVELTSSPFQESPEFSFLETVELFDTNSTFTGILGTARFGHTSTLLNNGLVLVTGGSEGFGTALATAEIYK